MSFNNRIRLPLYLKTPQFPTEANRFRLSDGTSKTLSVVVRKTWEIQTDYMGELTHQRLVIALNHDNVNIEGDKYIGGIAVDGDYEIDWPEFLDYPLGQAKVKVQVTPFDATNSNCQTCEEATQLSLVDDDIGEILEGESKSMNVFANDNICCFPIVAEIISFAIGYLDSASIDAATGQVTLVAKNPVASVGSIILATYRVSCPNGAYDEADIYGSISGSEPACEQPSGFIDALFPADGEADIEWTAPGSDPADGYEWQLYDMANPGTVLQSGTSPGKTVHLTGLSSGINYGFFVRSVCSPGVYSPYSEFDFTTPSGSGGACGRFNVVINDGTTGSDSYDYEFINCDGEITMRTGINLHSYSNCMLMDETHNPVYFSSTDPVFTVTYDGLCTPQAGNVQNNNNGGMDIVDLTVGGVDCIYVSGQTLPIRNGEAGYYSYPLGAVTGQTLAVYIGGGSAVNIKFTDNAGEQNQSVSGAGVYFFTVTINPMFPVFQIELT